MIRKVFIRIISIILILIICLYSNISYAVRVEVTEENLRESFDELVRTLEQNAEDGETTLKDITVTENNITITLTDNESFEIRYDLTELPTFRVEAPVYEGMTQEEFEKQMSSIYMPIYAYIAVANIQGVEIEDAMVYILMSIFQSLLNQSELSENIGEIVANQIMSSNMNLQDSIKADSDGEVTFEDGVINYVNEILKEPQLISDSESINSYTLNITKSDMTETTGKLVSELTVNLDADFSELIDYQDKLEESFMNQDITEDNADYVLRLKVGQKCKIQTNSTSVSVLLSGSDCTQWDSNQRELTAIADGKANGYLYLDDITKTLYVIVEENTTNETLETITLNINDNDSTNSPSTNNPTDDSDTDDGDVDKVVNINQNNNSNSQRDDGTTSIVNLPMTGINYYTLLLISLILVVIIIITIRKLRKWKEI